MLRWSTTRPGGVTMVDLKQDKLELAQSVGAST